ncbi:MAG: glycosyltransferase [Methylacidiphilales bacterium]|nr:glycosyltransferase [Candidatus Methylacidiphilales bacterium]
MKPVVVLSCLYDDWKSAAEVFKTLGEELGRRGWPAQLILIDDGSFEPRPADFLKGIIGFSLVEVVTLNRNVGHQRAIAVGLSHVFETKSEDAVAIMDADGEDRPADLIQLIESFAGQKNPQVVFAARAKRSETALFRVCYQFYRALHFFLTGYGIRFGNFSIVPRPLLGRLVVDPNLWLHFAATVVSSRVPYTTIPTRRGARLFGKSKFNLTSLVIHGIAALSCYNELIGVRLIFCSMGLSVILTLLIIAAIIIRLATPWAIPGWATSAVGVLLVLLVQVFLMVLAFAALAISSRKAHFFFPIQQYKFLIRDVETIR